MLFMILNTNKSFFFKNVINFEYVLNYTILVDGGNSRLFIAAPFTADLPAVKNEKK